MTFLPYRGVNFIDYKRLAKAIETRDRSYQLLMWIGDRVDQGKIQPSRAAHRCSGPHSVSELIRDYYLEIPISMLPPFEEIEEFSAFFSTFLTSSFDVIEKPGTRGEGPLVCTCDICLRLRNAPHLQAKKLYAREKREANLLMLECMQLLVRKNG